MFEKLGLGFLKKKKYVVFSFLRRCENVDPYFRFR